MIQHFIHTRMAKDKLRRIDERSIQRDLSRDLLCLSYRIKGTHFHVGPGEGRLMMLIMQAVISDNVQRQDPSSTFWQRWCYVDKAVSGGLITCQGEYLCTDSRGLLTNLLPCSEGCITKSVTMRSSRLSIPVSSTCSTDVTRVTN